MSGITLVFDKPVTVAMTPNTFEELTHLVEATFPYAEVQKASYVDDDGDEVGIRTTKDLEEAYRLCKLWGKPRLEVKLEGRLMSQSFMTESTVAKVKEPESVEMVQIIQEKKPDPVEKIPILESIVLEQPVVAEVAKVEIVEPPQMQPVQVKQETSVIDPVPREEERLVECFKCGGQGVSFKGFPCKNCSGSGVTDLNKHPKMKRIIESVRKEVERSLSRSSILAAAKEKERTQGLHPGVTCTGCRQSPIVGCRYKCSVCQNFEYCSTCEETRKHEHPFIKIRSPGQNPSAIMVVVNEDQKGKPLPTQPKEEKLLCKYVKDVVGKDGETHSPGETFRKVWKVKNAGKEWPQGCTFSYDSGAFQGRVVDLPALRNNEECDVETVCTAPMEEGRYTSFWRAKDPQGRLFGDRLWIDIKVQKFAVSLTKSTGRLQEFLASNPVLTVEILQKTNGDVSKAVEKLAELLR